MPVQQYDIVLNYDTSKATSSLAAFRAQVISEFGKLADKTAKFQVLKDLDADAQKSVSSLATLNVRANELKRILEVMGKGDAGFAQLNTELKSVTAEIKKAEGALASSTARFNELSASGQHFASAAQASFAKVAQLRSALDGLAQSGVNGAGLSGIAIELRKTEAALSASTAKFDRLSESGRVFAATAQSSYARVAQLRSALDGLESGDAAFKRLSSSLVVAEKDLAKSESAVIKNKLQLAELAREAQTAGEKLEKLRAAASTVDVGEASFKRLSAALVVAEKDLATANNAVVKNKLQLSEFASQVQVSSEKINALRASAASLADALKKSEQGAVGYKTLQDNLRNVEAELKATERAAKSQATQLKALEQELGVSAKDTSKLAAEQLALAKALDTAQRAVATQTARGVLGVVNTDEARAQIKKLQDAYNVLRADGTATLNDLAQAKSRLVAKTIEVNAQQSILTGSMQQLQGAFVAVIGSVGAYALAVSAVTTAASRYEQGLASIASITNLNKVQLDALGQSVLRLAGQIGLDGVEAFRALYSIIGSGIPPENALRVLEASSRAAIAGLTGVENAAQIGVQVLNAYQLQVGQLDRVYDILFQTVRDGVISFEELAEKFGLVLPAARTAGVSLEELSAATVVLTRNGLTAPRAMVALEGAIKQLAAPSTEAAGAMAELDIQYNGFAGTIEQFARKNIGPELLRRLIPDVEGQRAVALLSSNYNLLATSLDEATNAAGATKDAFNKLKDTPEQALKKFSAELNRAQVAAGKALLEGLLPLLNGATDLIKAFNDLPAGLRNSVTTLTAVGGALAVTAIAARAITPIIAPIVAGIGALGTSGALAAAGIGAATTAITAFIPAALAAGVPAYQFGQWLRESSAYARQFGDTLGGGVAAAIIDVSERLRYMTALVSGDTAEMKRASEAIDRNKLQYVELTNTIGANGAALQQLEVKQASLRKSLEETQATVGKVGAKFTDAFSQVVEAVDKPLTELNARINRTASNIEAAQGRIGASATAARDLYAAQIAQIDQSLAQQTAAIQVSVAKRELTETAGIKKVTDATVAANATRLKALNDHAAAAIKAFDLDAQARIAVARKTGADVEKIEIELRTSRIALINELAGKYNEYITGAKRAEESLRDKVKEVDDQVRKIRSDAADFNNRLLTKTGGDVRAYYERSNQAEQALADAARASGEVRQRYLERAKALAGSLGDAVTDATGREVTAARAAANAQDIYNRAAKIELDDLAKKRAALDAAADAYKKSGEAAVAQGVDIKNQLDKLFPEQGEKVTIRLEKDEAQIKEKLASLQADVLAQAPLAFVKLQIDAAKADYDVFKLAVEKNRPQVEIEGKFDAFKEKAKEAFDSLPQVPVKVDAEPAKAAIGELESSVTAFFATKRAVQSNVDEITEKVKALSTLDTSSTHTVFVKYVTEGGKKVAVPDAPPLPGFRTGGLVSVDGARARTAAIAHFASGGFVGRVPGVGNTDSVFARLQAGSFILRKTPSEILAALSSSGAGGSNIFNRLRDGSSGRRVPGSGKFSGGIDAGSGTSGSIDSLIEAVQARGTFERGGMISSLMEGAIRAMRNNVTAYRAGKPLGFVERDAEDVTERNARPKVRAVQQAYSAAAATRNEGAAGSATSAAIELAKELIAPLDNINFGLLGQKGSGNFLADGGSPVGRGIIPAMLTPGEISFGPAEVKRIGLGRLQAMNAANSREQLLASLMHFNAGGSVPTMGESFAENVLPMLRRFNEGGSVTNANTSNTANNTFNFTVNAGSNIDERALAQRLYSEFSAIERRRR